MIRSVEFKPMADMPKKEIALELVRSFGSVEICAAQIGREWALTDP